MMSKDSLKVASSSSSQYPDSSKELELSTTERRLGAKQKPDTGGLALSESDGKRRKREDSTLDDESQEDKEDAPYAYFLRRWIWDFKARKTYAAMQEATKLWDAPIHVEQCTLDNIAKGREEHRAIHPTYVEDAFGHPFPKSCLSSDIMDHAKVISERYLSNPAISNPAISLLDSADVIRIAATVRIMAALYHKYADTVAQTLSEADILWVQIVVLHYYVHTNDKLVEARVRCRDYLIECGVVKEHAWIYSGALTFYKDKSMQNMVYRLVHDVIALGTLGKKDSFFIDALPFYTHIAKNDPDITIELVSVLSDLYTAFPQGMRETATFSIKLSNSLRALEQIACLPKNLYIVSTQKMMDRCRKSKVLAPLCMTPWQGRGPSPAPEKCSDHLSGMLYQRLCTLLESYRVCFHHTTTMDALIGMLEDPDCPGLLGKEERARWSVTTSSSTPSIGGVDHDMVFAGMNFYQTFPNVNIPLFTKRPENVTIIFPEKACQEHASQILRHMIVSQHLAPYSYQHNSTLVEGENPVFAGDTEVCTRKVRYQEFYIQDTFTRSITHPNKTLFRSITPADSIVRGWDNIKHLLIKDIATWLASLGSDNPLTQYILSDKAGGKSLEDMLNVIARFDRWELKIPSQLPIVPGTILLFNQGISPELREQICQRWPYVRIKNREVMAKTMDAAGISGDIEMLKKGITKGYPLDGESYHLSNTSYPLVGAIQEEQYETVEWLIDHGAHPMCFGNHLLGAAIYDPTISCTHMDVWVLFSAIESLKNTESRNKMRNLFERKQFQFGSLLLCDLNRNTWVRLCNTAVNHRRADVVRLLLQHHTVAKLVPDESKLALYNEAFKRGDGYIESLFVKFRMVKPLSHPTEELKVAAQFHQVNLLKRYYVTLDRKNQESEGPDLLYHLVKCGSIRGVEAFIKSGVSCDLSDRGGNSLLHIAAQNNRVSIIRQLCAHKLQLSQVRNTKGETPLDMALHQKKWRSVRALTEAGVPIESPEQFNRILDLAFRFHDIKMLDTLIETCRTYDRVGALFFAVKYSRAALVRRYIEQEKTDTFVVDIISGNTLMHAAIENNASSATIDTLGSLMGSEAINRMNICGMFPLDVAWFYSHLDAVKALVKYTACTNDTFGGTLIHQAVRSGNPGVLNVVLREHPDIDINTPDLGGRTALFQALIFRTDLIIIQKLLEKKPALNSKIYGENAFHIAVESCYVDAIPVLLDYLKSDPEPALTINTPNSKGQSPLDVAQMLESKEMIGVLMKYGAESHLENPSHRLDQSMIAGAGTSSMLYP